MAHEAQPIPRPAPGPAFDEQETNRLPSAWPVRAGASRPPRRASQRAFDEQPTDPLQPAWWVRPEAQRPAQPISGPAFDEQPTTRLADVWRAWAGAPRPVPTIVADILPTHGRAYARLRVRGRLDLATRESLLQTCRCLVRRNVVRIVVDVTDLEGDGTGLEDLVELHVSLEKRGGGIGLIAPTAPSSRTGAPSGLPTYRDERQALEGLVTDTTAEDRQSGRHARLILPTGHAWPLSDSVLTIGRGTGNHLRLDDPLLAPEHAAIVRAGDEYVLIDWGSERGTFVNGGDGRDLHFLQDGDRIEIGDSILIFRSGALVTSRAGMTLFDWDTPSKEPAPAGASSDPAGGVSLGDQRRQPEDPEHRTRGGQRRLTVIGGSRRGARCDSDATACAWCGDYLSWFRFSVLIAGQAQVRFPVWADERAERPAWGAPPHFVFADDSGRRWLRIRFQVSLVTGWMLALAFLWWYLVLQ